jgi:molybdenum cofactor cytidylyltransferase
MPNKRLAVLIVAAGSSSRLGQPKQLVKWKNKTLLEHSIDCAKSVSDHVYVVLGANSDQITSKISFDHFLHFPHWQTGMGSSIAFGLSNILTDQPHIDSAIIMVCDQPYVTPGILRQLCEQHSSSENLITACTYAGIIGVPAIFSKQTFPELLSLNGDKGAKVIVSKYQNQTGLFAFPEGLKDIDTPQDLQHLSD